MQLNPVELTIKNGSDGIFFFHFKNVFYCGKDHII